ncbi:MAG: hypothetical protein JSV83_13430, partial [Desulfobacterales bacterium]
MKENEIQSRIDWLLDEIAPLTYQSDFDVAPHAYLPDSDTLYLDVRPRSASRWAQVAHDFGHHEYMKFDRSYKIYGIDGQPRVSYSGLVWVRYIAPFEDNCRVGLNIWSLHPSHEQAEAQL